MNRISWKRKEKCLAKSKSGKQMEQVCHELMSIG